MFYAINNTVAYNNMSMINNYVERYNCAYLLWSAT